jgi:hypothetical protein
MPVVVLGLGACSGTETDADAHEGDGDEQNATATDSDGNGHTDEVTEAPDVQLLDRILSNMDWEPISAKSLKGENIHGQIRQTEEVADFLVALADGGVGWDVEAEEATEAADDTETNDRDWRGRRSISLISQWSPGHSVPVTYREIDRSG